MKLRDTSFGSVMTKVGNCLLKNAGVFFAQVPLKLKRVQEVVAPLTKHRPAAGFYDIGFWLGFWGHFVKWLRSSPILNSLWHQPQGTIVGGLPPGCLDCKLFFMEITI